MTDKSTSMTDKPLYYSGICEMCGEPATEYLQYPKYKVPFLHNNLTQNQYEKFRPVAVCSRNCKLMFMAMVNEIDDFRWNE